jgi:hypothetical protein
MGNIFTNIEITAAIVGAVLAFALGIITVYFAQILSDRKNKAQITYSKKVEVPLIMSDQELKKKIRLLYEGSPVESLYSCEISIINSGKKTIKNQSIIIKFPEKTRNIDSASPKIKTKPEYVVGPIRRDETINETNVFSYIILKIGKGQEIKFNFLTENNDSNDVDVIFSSNDEQEVNFVEGDVSLDPSLENHLQVILFGIFSFYVSREILKSLPIYGDVISPLSVIFLIPIVRIIKPTVSEIFQYISNRNKHDGVNSGTVYIYDGTINGPIAGFNGGNIDWEYESHGQGSNIENSDDESKH